MKNAVVRLFVSFSILCALLGIVSLSVGQQVADPNFNSNVPNPAYVDQHPKVLFDEAHNNIHTTNGRYQPFAELITRDGYQVTANREKFYKKILASYHILVIANAFGGKIGTSAFSSEECEAVRDWVKAGGSLLLIADHAPFGAAAEILAKRFDVDMSNSFTIDLSHYDRESGNPGFLIFTSDNGLLVEHPITQGRNLTERINRVITFTGQSLKGKDGSVAFLRLSDTAVDLNQRLSQTGISAAGRAQGIALQFGKGRVVFLGEAAMISAQLIRGAEARSMGKGLIQIGMNRKGFDNQQLALNIMHWLSRLLN